MTKETLVTLLNREPLRCISVTAAGNVEVQVVGLGRWASFAQRSICGANTSASVFMNMNKHWGVPEEAVKYRQRIDLLFGGVNVVGSGTEPRAGTKGNEPDDTEIVPPSHAKEE
jgi:hypothetical protein